VGVDALEMDLLLTKDRVLVVSHDPRLHPDIARGPGGLWLGAPGPPIASLTFDDLLGFDVGRLRPGSAYAAAFPDQVPCDGERIPRLAEVFALADRAADHEVCFNLEIKTNPRRPEETAPPPAIADAVVQLVRESGLTARTTLQSFDWRVVRRVRERGPEIRTACLTSEQPEDDTIDAGRPGPKPWLAGLDPSAFGGSVPRMVRSTGSRVWSPDFLDLTAGRLREARDLGLAVVVWTVNRPEDMVRLVDLGVDGIITDRPDLLRAVMIARGMAVPRATPVTR